MKNTSLLAVAGLLTASLLQSGIAQAKPQYYNTLMGAYPGSKIAVTTQCQTCHDGGKKLNPFGHDFYSLVLKSDVRPMNFRVLDELDSDGDGMSNLDEIMNKRNPGKKD